MRSSNRPVQKAAPPSRTVAPARNPYIGFVEERHPAMPLPADGWLPAPYDISDVTAFQRCWDGTAEAHQQRAVIEWILFASGKNGPAFAPGQPDVTAFAEGKRWLGIQVMKLLNLNIASLRGKS